MTRGRDRRTRSGVGEAAQAAVRDPRMFAALIDAMRAPDAVVAQRSAAAADRASATDPRLLEPYKADLLGRLAQIDERAIRWHVAQMLPRLRLDPAERERAVELVVGWLEGNDAGGIADAGGYESLAVLADGNEELIGTVRPLLERHAASGPPALRARAKAALGALH